MGNDTRAGNDQQWINGRGWGQQQARKGNYLEAGKLFVTRTRARLQSSGVGGGLETAMIKGVVESSTKVQHRVVAYMGVGGLSRPYGLRPRSVLGTERQALDGMT